MSDYQEPGLPFHHENSVATGACARSGRGWVSPAHLLTFPLTFIFWVGLMLLGSWWQLAGAQTVVQIRGTVTDQASGEPLAAVNVVLVGSSYGAMTDNQGLYTIEQVPPGRYTVQASMLGYKTGIRPDVEVDGGVTTWVNFQLKVAPIPFPKIRVTAPRAEVALELPSAFVVVISRDEIEASGAQTVGELLQTTAGILIQDYGSLGSAKTIAIRGSDSKQVLILLDGVKLNDAQQGTVDLNTIPLAMVERMEVLRGGASTRYGSEAVGGVVNLISRMAHKSGQIDVHLEGTRGSFGTTLGSAYSAARFKAWEYTLAVYLSRSAGTFAFTDRLGQRRRRGNADVTAENIFARTGWWFGKGGRLWASYEWYDADRGVPGTSENPTPLARMTDRRQRFRLQVENPWGRTRLQASAYLHRYRTGNRNPVPNIYLYRNTTDQNGVVGLEGRLQRPVGARHTWAWGGEIRRETVQSTNTQDQIRRSVGFYGQDDIVIVPGKGGEGTLTLHPALRWDYFSGFRAAWSPRIGLVYANLKGSGLTLKSNLGRSFRAPTLNSLFWVGAFARGNPNLKPERALNFDLGVTLQRSLAGEMQLELIYFENTIRDQIRWLPGPNNVWSPRNVNRVRSRGLESRWQWDSPAGVWHGELNYTLLDVRNRQTGKVLEFRPRHVVQANLRVGYGGWTGTLEQQIVSQRFQNPANNNPLLGYALTNLSIAYRQSWTHFRLAPQVDFRNLFDTRYMVISQNPLPGREIRASLKLRW